MVMMSLVRSPAAALVTGVAVQVVTSALMAMPPADRLRPSPQCDLVREPKQ
jgi:hypothetical protein